MVQIGDKVRLISDPQRQGIVLEVLSGPGAPTLKVFFGPDDETYVSAHDTEPVLSIAETLLRDPVTNKELAFRYLLAKATERLDDVLYSYAASRTDFLAYQFKPVLKFLHSEHRRLYIADEVGLGKTIEAALILLEYLARTDVQAALIVCPANLTSKWKTEMNRRFALGFSIYKARELQEFLSGERRVPVSGLRAICSLQSLRTTAMQEAITSSPFSLDFIILDEAHNIKNANTASWHLAELLSQRAAAMLMLSATPLMLGQDDLYNQLSVLIPSMFPDFRLFQRMLEPNRYLNEARRLLAQPSRALKMLRRIERTAFAASVIGRDRYKRLVTRLSSGQPLSRDEQVRAHEDLRQLSTLSAVYVRTRKREVQTTFPVRRAHVLRVPWTDAERTCYDAVRASLQQSALLSGHSAPGLSLVMPLRLAASCLPAMAEYVHSGPPASSGSAPDDGDSPNNSTLDPVTDDIAATWIQPFLRRLLELQAEVRARMLALGGTDSKFEALMDLLESLSGHDEPPKVVLFSFFKKTLRYLEEQFRLREWLQYCLTIDGDTPPAVRAKRLRQFQQDSSVRLLLSTEVGGEGVDLQCASVLVNYDLPWNPMRVEQRIGRLDRYGQKSEIIEIYNFSLPGTIDAIILERLYERLGVFREYIGDLDPILGDVESDLGRILFNPTLSDAELEKKLEMLALSAEERKRAIHTLEERTADLMGFDEFFQEELSGIRRQGRFFRPQELSFLTQGLLERLLDESEVLQRVEGEDGTWRLRAPSSLTALLRATSRDNDSVAEFLDKCQRGAVDITFDAGEAQENPELELVSRQHPLMVSLLRKHLAVHRQRGVPVSVIHLDLPNLRGEYAFFVCILERLGIVKTRDLRHLLVRRDSLEIYNDSDRTREFFANLVDADPGWRPSPEDLVWFQEAEKFALNHMMETRQEEEKRFREDEEERRQLRRFNIERETEIRIQRAEAAREKVLYSSRPDSRILRLYEGRIRRLREEEMVRLDKLDQIPAPMIRFRFAIAGIAVCQ